MQHSTAIAAFGLLLVAEFGDKSQWMALALAQRHRPLPVLAGALVAFAVLNGLTVTFGNALAQLVPQAVVLFLAGSLFLVVGVSAWRNAGQVEDASTDTNASARWVWLLAFALIFAAEFGDKTQFTMVALSAQPGAAWAVFVGGTAALWVLALLAVVVGKTALRRVPRVRVQRVGAFVFMVFAAISFSRLVWVTVGPATS